MAKKQEAGTVKREAKVTLIDKTKEVMRGDGFGLAARVDQMHAATWACRGSISGVPILLQVTLDDHYQGDGDAPKPRRVRITVERIVERT